MPLCIHHPDHTPCPVKMAIEASDLVQHCKSDREAGALAIESIRMIFEHSGARAGGRTFAGVVNDIAESKSMDT